MRVTVTDEHGHQVGQYKCDFCKANLTEDNAGHLSLVIGERSGYAEARNPARLPGWRLTKLWRPMRVHFCAPVCLGKWAEATMYYGAAPPEYLLGGM